MIPTIRPYRREDAPTLLTLFRDTIRRVNCRDYTAEQVAAWSSDEIDPINWANRFEGRYVVVGEVGGRIVGFAELEQNGHIDRVYVATDDVGMGIGKVLVGELIAEASRSGLAQLFVEASITARPFFDAMGFTVVARQQVNCRGVELTNFRMEQVLQGETPVEG